ncbi:MAG TPA: PQQ-dependent sugar dehydrogenase [Alphaproteobacteria bacterium]
MARSHLPLGSLVTAALTAAAPAMAVDETFRTDDGTIRVTTVAAGLEHPWGLAVLPDGRMLVTEKPGRLRLVSADGTLSDPLAGAPEVDARGQGGLLDVALDPEFETNRLIYLSYAEPGDGGNSTAVARAVLSEDAASLSELEVIFSQKPKLPSEGHFGSRLVFDGHGNLFVTLGERFKPEFRVQAQELDSHVGKIVRIRPDGGVPEDNPFVGQSGALPEIWSYGHRNIQAAAIHPETGALWAIEHGPRGGDEINIAEPGVNYGWPVVSHGVNYDGTPVGTGRARQEGMADPLHTWTPVIAPSGMTFYTGSAFPDWRGDLFVGGLKATALVRLELDGTRVAYEERLLEDLGKRIRDVVQGPDGSLYLLTDEDNGEVLRVAPGDQTAEGG